MGALKGTETILVVEDDDEVRAVTLDLLKRHGYNVYEAASGEEALQLCATDNVAIDLVVSDTIMPVMNGPELAKRLREIRPGLKTVFISGYTDTALSRSGVIEDEIVLIPKPFSAATLTQGIRKVLDA